MSAGRVRTATGRARIGGLVLAVGLSGCGLLPPFTSAPTQTPTRPPGGEVVLTIDSRTITGSWSLACLKVGDGRRLLVTTKDTRGTYEHGDVEVALTADATAVDSLTATFRYANSVTRSLRYSAPEAAEAGTSAAVVATDLTYEISGTGQLKASAKAKPKLVPYRFVITCQEWQEFG